MLCCGRDNWANYMVWYSDDIYHPETRVVMPERKDDGERMATVVRGREE